MSRSILTVCVPALLIAWGIALPASDPVGIYAAVDRVVLEPDQTAPDRVQIWGSFTQAKSPGGTYFPPERGFLYYSLPQGSEKAARAEWHDLDQLAGSDQVVAFGSRYESLGRIRKSCEAVEEPDVYPTNFGLTKIIDPTRLATTIELLSLPAPVSPADRSRGVLPGEVKLAVENVRFEIVKGLEYFFEIEGGYGGTERDVSPAIEIGNESPEGHTSWRPSLRLQPGATYRWRSWVSGGGFTGAKAEACFHTGYLRGDVNGDAQLDVSDGVSILNYLFLGGIAPVPLEVADVNDSREIDVTDSVYLLNYLFLGGPAPVAFDILAE